MYPIGISLLYVVLMMKARHALLGDQPTALSKALGFLVRARDLAVPLHRGQRRWP